MATSGTATFTLDLGEIVEEAYERAGLRLDSGYDYLTAIRSLNLLMIEWQNRGTNFWTVDEETFSTTAGTATYTLEADAFGVATFFVRTGSGTTQVDTPLSRISLKSYAGITNKNVQGKPINVWVDKRQDEVQVRLWPTPDDTYTVTYYQLARIEDAGRGNASLNPDVPFRFLPALAAGLALKIAQKRAPQMVEALMLEYERQWADAEASDRERSSLYLRPAIGR